MAKERSRFVKGCARVNGIPEATADAIFDFIARFADRRVQQVAQRGLRLAFVSNRLSEGALSRRIHGGAADARSSTTDRLSEIIAECNRMGIKILAPDVNRSSLHFTPEALGEGMAIRFGLASIKNVGAGAMQSVIEERERSGLFRSLQDFCARLDGRTVNRKILESLVKCGAFDDFGKSRAELFTKIDRAMLHAAGLQRDRASGQGGALRGIVGDARAGQFGGHGRAMVAQRDVGLRAGVAWFLSHRSPAGGLCGPLRQSEDHVDLRSARR